MRRVRELAPRTPVVPVYFFVGTMGPGATVKEVTPQGGEGGLGILVPSEVIAITPAMDMSEFPEGQCGRGDGDDADPGKNLGLHWLCASSRGADTGVFRSGCRDLMWGATVSLAGLQR